MNTIEISMPNQSIIMYNGALWQYDYGVQLKITGLVGLNPATPVHFAIANSKDAEVRTGSYSDGVLTVTIPNAMTEQPREFWAYVFNVDGESGKTVRGIKFAPAPRGKPTGIVTPDEQSAFDDLVDEFNQIITDADLTGLRNEVETARGTYGTVGERLDDADNAQDIRITELRQQLAEANKTIANMGDGRITVDGGYGNISALPKTAAVAAMNSILYGMTVTPLVAQSAVAVGDTVSFASVLNSKYYDSLHKAILTGTGSTMTITNDTEAVANINVIDLTAFGLSTLTAAQCQAAFPSFFTGAQSAQVTCIEATGKNLFDGKLEQGEISSSTGSNISSNEIIRSKNYIRVEGGSTYIISRSIDTLSFGTRYYDANYNYIGIGIGMNVGVSAATMVLPSNVAFIRLRDLSNNLNGTFQIELGSTVTDYEPYYHTEQYIEPYPLYRVPNGTACKIDTANNEYVPSVKRYVLKADDVGDLKNTINTNNDYVIILIDIMPDVINYGVADPDGDKISTTISAPRLGAAFDSATTVWKHSLTAYSLIITTPKGFYSNVEEAKTALAGTVIFYQLSDEAKQASTIKNVVTGNILSRPNGTIQFGNKHSFTSMVVDGKLPTRTNYADIATVERLEKLNTDGTLTPLDITLATIAADKRSISHPQLVNGAIARCKYAYSFGGVNGRKDISYVTGQNLVTDSVTGKVYKVGKAIADGVMTDTMTEVV